MGIGLSAVLFILGIVFIYLNTLSNQKHENECNICGTKKFGKKCPKCGYVSYEKDEFKSNAFMSFMGVAFIILSVVHLVYYASVNEEYTNEIMNKIVDFVEDVTYDDTTDNSPDLIEDDDSIEDDDPIEDDEDVSNIEPNNKPSQTEKQEIVINTSGVGTVIDGCDINSFTAKIQDPKMNAYVIEYTIGVKNNKSGTYNNMCNVYISLYDEDHDLIDKWSSFSFVEPGKTGEIVSFKFVYQKSSKYYLTLSNK